MTDSDPLSRFDRAARVAGSVIRGITPEQLGDPTPCTEWTVRELINHLVTGNQFFVGMLTGGAPVDRGRDHLGDDPAGAFDGSTARLRAHFAAPDVLRRVVPTPFGEQPASMLVGMRVNEMMIHSWDLARATGQSTDLDPELAEVGIGAFRAMRAAGRGGTMFRAEQPVPEGATAADRLAATAGRTVT